MEHEHRLSGFVRLALVTALAVPFALAQQQGGQQQAPPPSAPPGGGAPGGTTERTPSPIPGPGRQPQEPRFPSPQEQQRFPEMQRPIFLSGKVVMDDGSAPPDSVVIERVCNGVPRPEAYTDSKGRFSFQLGQNANMMPDASVSSSADPSFGGSRGGFGSDFPGATGNNRGISERDLMGCELRASLPGYRSEVVNLSGRRFMDNPDVGTIILRRLGNVEGLTISATSLQAPKDAKKAFEKGRDRSKKKKFDDAQKELEKAVKIYPKYAAAWHELGMVYEQQKKPEEARKAYEQALAADSKFINPYLQLALMDARESKWQEVADTTDRVVKLNPYDFPAAYFYNSVANLNLQKLDAAEKSAREAVKLNAQRRFPQVEHVLGIVLAQKNELPEAAEHMKAYLQLVPDAGNADTVKKQLAEIEKFLGKGEVTQQQ